jgi:hypothetical protein
MSDDMRDYYTLYGIYLGDWTTTWGGNTFNHHLVKNMISSSCSSTASSTWTSAGRSFLYPHYIKKKYFLEGVVEGEIAFGSAAASSVSDFRVSIFKLNTDTTNTVLATTGVISVNDNLKAAYGYYNQYHFWIDVYEKKELDEYDRIGVKIEWNVDNSSTTTAKLMHEVVSSDYDFWIDIPFML